ncbi:hypothetical protein COV87_02355, partial [Candidatus Roizmanbacteria bacterium CG11_big_fil_rev_8_21_14_0_20_37_16]
MDKKLGGLLLVFFLLFTVFATIVLFNGQFTTFTRAKEDFAPSAKASLLFAYPLLLKADGKEKSTINIFVRSDKGMPVKDKKLSITSTVGTLSDVEATTDEKGKATVTLTSATPGTAI